jgi:hypothetical protein
MKFVAFGLLAIIALMLAIPAMMFGAVYLIFLWSIFGPSLIFIIGGAIALAILVVLKMAP